MRKAAMRTAAACVLTLSAGGCGLVPEALLQRVLRPKASPPQVEADTATAPPAFDFPHPVVWTASRGVTVHGDSASFVLPRTFTALEVLGADSAGVLVRCESCPRIPVGRVPHDEVIHTPMPPATAAHGTLAEFALAIRAAAERGDTAALTPVMAYDFTFSFVGEQGVPQALAGWRSDDLRTLALVPALLDRGLAPAPGGVWAAPPEFVDDPGYHGLRLGFRRTAGGTWEWLFLLRGEGLT